MTKTSARWIFVTLALLALCAPRGFGQAPEPMTVDAAKRQAIVDEVSSILNKNYIFAETAKKIEDLIRDRLKNGGYDKLTDAQEFAEALSQDLLSVSKDRHMGFAYAPQMAAEIIRRRSRNEDEARAARERMLTSARRNNFGFRKVEQLPGNIGYLDFRSFASADQAGPTAVAALNFLAYCDAVIIDLRQNGGGDPSQIQLISSYFFPEPAHLNDIYYRAEDKTENYWTLPYVPGAKPVSADLYILTSRDTFSGAEEFSYNMKNLKRATLIGETTGGGAHPTDAMIVQEKFILRVPIARAINPISKTNWEGTGVTPDIPVPAPQAFDRAYTMALEKLAAKATDPDRKNELAWIITGMKARENPLRVAEKILKMYPGVYGERKVSLENGVLYYQRTGPKYRLVPMTETLFSVEGLDYFRLEFVVKDGKATGVVGLYDNGDKDTSPRTK
ncbi:MAG: S41 family peptidase [Candidatus Aminicenantales bacterium]